MGNLKIVTYTLTYFITSLTLGFFSSYFLSEKEYNFKYPLFISGCQNMMHFILATAVITAKQSFRVETNLYTLPCAITAAIDIGISSYALRRVTLAFYTMVKSSAPVFILLCGFAFGIEKPSIFLFLVMFTVGCGVFLTTMVDTKFDMHGFGLISLASLVAGFRWAFVQYLIQNRKSRNTNCVVTVQELCLPISVLLLLCSCKFEGVVEIIKKEFMYDYKKALFNAVFIFFIGTISFVLLLSEFYLVEQTSVVYLGMSGIVKELVIVVYSVLRSTIKLNTINMAGLFISITGIFLFNIASKKPLKEEKLNILHNLEQV